MKESKAGGSVSPPDEDEEDSCVAERIRLAVYDRIGLEAAKAIKESGNWPENAWPSPVERIWYTVAQKEIAELRAALRGRVSPAPSKKDLALAINTAMQRDRGITSGFFPVANVAASAALRYFEALRGPAVAEPTPQEEGK